MIIKTKKYKLENNLYIKLCFKNIIHEQWWIFIFSIFMCSITVFIHIYWFIFCTIFGVVSYFLFWFIQFYGITRLDQNQLIFEKLSYQISDQQIFIQYNNKQGIPILWNKIRYAFKGSDYFLLSISQTHIVYLPYKIFNSKYEIKLTETILSRKHLLVNYL